MKRIISILLICTITLTCSFIKFNNYSFANNLEPAKYENVKVIKAYLNEAEKLSKNLDLIGKHVMSAKENNDEKKLDEHLKNINYIQSQSLSLSDSIYKDYNYYKSQGIEDVYEVLLSIIAVMSDYNLSLQELGAYIQCESLEDKYMRFSNFVIVQYRGDTILEGINKFFN